MIVPGTGEVGDKPLSYHTLIEKATDWRFLVVRKEFLLLSPLHAQGMHGGIGMNSVACINI